MSQNAEFKSKPVKIPGPDHPMKITRNPGRIVVTVAGHVVANSGDALVLQESSYPAVHYIPRRDVDMSLLEKTKHTTYCPYKGECSYFSIPVGGERSTNAVWSYETPHHAVSEITEFMAFYPDRVDQIEERS